MKLMPVPIGKLLILSGIIRTDVIINSFAIIAMVGRSWNTTLKIINQNLVRMEKTAIKAEIVRTIILIKIGGRSPNLLLIEFSKWSLEIELYPIHFKYELDMETKITIR